MIESTGYTDPTNVDFSDYDGAHKTWLLEQGETEASVNDALYRVFDYMRPTMQRKGVQLLRHKGQTCLMYRPMNRAIGAARMPWKPVKLQTLQQFVAQFNSSVESQANIDL